MTDSQDPEVEFSRRLAAHMIGRLEVSTAAATDQLIKTSGWLTASLLAINGGGGLATLNVVGQLSEPWLPASLFGAGILLALLNAVAVQGFQSRLYRPLEDLLAYWRRVEIYGERDNEDEEALVSGATGVLRWAPLAPTFGWISGLLFFAGSASLLNDAARVEGDIGSRCMALQTDMLSLRPHRDDSRELFIALQCKASATGRVATVAP